MKTHRTKLAVTTLMLAGLALLTFGAPANAQDSYEGAGSCNISSVTVPPGGTITVTGTGFAPGGPVDIILHSDPVLLGTVNADASGNVTLVATVPAGTPLGAHTVECSGGGVSETTGFTVVSSTTATTATTGSLPKTGSDSTDLLRVAVVFIVAGAALVVAVRRRKPSERTAA